MTSDSGAGEEPSFCGNCGAAVQAGSRTCDICGQPVAGADEQPGPPPADYIPYCRSCGVGVPWGMGHACQRCGITPLCQLHFRADSGLCLDCAAAPVYVGRAETSYGASGLSCQACGAAVSPNADFCPNCGQAVFTTLYQTVDYMGFWIRFAAFVADRIITYLIAVLIAFAIGISRTSGESEPVPAEDISVALENINYSFLLLVWGVSVVYGVLLTGLRGQTLGKMLLRIQVVDANGNIPSWHRIVVRELLGKSVSEIVLWLGYLWVTFDQRKRGWHDYLGGSYVVRRLRTTGPSNRGF